MQCKNTYIIHREKRIEEKKLAASYYTVAWGRQYPIIDLLLFIALAIR
jgi:hypothetical protein